MDPQAQANKAQQQKPNLFLLEEKKEFKFKQPPQKIMGCCPMLNNTLAVIGIKSHRVEFVAHYDADGNLLKEIVFEDGNLFPYCIPNDRTIIWPDEDSPILYQWNLQTYEVLKFGFNYETDRCDSHEVFFFPETQTICVGEWGRHDSNHLKFTLFPFPLTETTEPLLVWEAPEGEWTYEYMVKKANSSNKMLWFRSPHKDTFEFRVFQFVKNAGKYEPKYTKYETKNQFTSANGTCEISAGFMWEMRPDVYGVVSITDRPHNENDWPNAIFVYEAANNSLREAKFGLEGKFRFQNIHWQAFGNTFMARAFDWDKGVSLEVDTYYFDNQTETLSAKGRWVCSNLHKYSFPGYDQNMIVDAEYMNLDPPSVVTTSIKVADLNVIVADILDQFIPTIDEDLCRAVVNLLKVN